jgi:hypothetical protein
VRLPGTILRLSRDEWDALFRSSIAVCFVRATLWVLPFRRVLRSVERLSLRRPVRPAKSRFSTTQLAWAVQAVSKRILPDRPCLTQALALLLLLRRQGFPAELRIGVRQSGADRLDAHAWVESDGRIVIGRVVDLPEYTPLPKLEEFRMRPKR